MSLLTVLHFACCARLFPSLAASPRALLRLSNCAGADWLAWFACLGRVAWLALLALRAAHALVALRVLSGLLARSVLGACWAPFAGATSLARRAVGRIAIAGPPKWADRKALLALAPA